jgi:hypothetical protein
MVVKLMKALMVNALVLVNLCAVGPDAIVHTPGTELGGKLLFAPRAI